MDRTEHRPARPLFRQSAAVLIALTLAACGSDTNEADTSEPADAGSAAEVFDRFNAMSGEERHDALVEAAKEEGSLVFYTPESNMSAVIEAFQDEYGITVDLYAAQSDTVLQRLMQEQEAGHQAVDVFEDSEAYTAAQSGLAYEYVNPVLTEEIPGYDPQSFVAPTRLSVYTQAWNTDMVSEDEIPGTLDGFTATDWEGRLSLDPRDWVWYTGVMDYYTQEKGWSEDDVDEMIGTLAGYARYNEGHTVNAELLLAGEFPATLSVYTDSVDAQVREHPDSPIAWRKSDGSYIAPLVYQPQGAIVMKNAPHPAAAMLFVDFLLDEGQQILSEQFGTATAIPQEGGPLDGVAAEDLVQVDFEKFTNERDEWVARWDELLRQH